jgi:hypothetical protein
LDNPAGVTTPGLELAPPVGTSEPAAQRDKTTTSPGKSVSQENVAATKKGASDGPPETKEASAPKSTGEDFTENPANEGVSVEEVSLDGIGRVIEKGKADAANVGGDFETPDSAGGERNVIAEDSGKASAPAGGSANASRTRNRHSRAAAEVKLAAEVMLAVKANAVSPSVNVEGDLILPVSMNGRGRNKLLIFNVHGTLLDSSLIAEKNPNSRIRATIKTKTRRVVFRPWLRAFLSRCCVNFAVAFWGSKSAAYMDEVVPAMIGGISAGSECFPLFVWSGKDCEPVDFEGDTAVAWGKSLAKVYEAWPQFGAHNTLIIDNKKSQISHNPGNNVVVSTSFYVAELEKLADDRNFLESTLWPLLQLFLAAADIKEFQRQLSPRKKKTRQDLRVNECAIEEVVSVEGEGTREPQGLLMFTSPHLHVHAILNMRICVCRRWRRKKRR